MAASTPPPDPPPSDADRRLIEGLFERNMTPLVAFIRARAGQALRARESAVDLAQSVCREVLQDLDDFEFRGEEAFRGWLFRQATRKIIDRHRYLARARRDAACEQPAAAAAEDDEVGMLQCYQTLCTPSVHASAREELQRIERAVEELPEAQRDAVTMSRLLGMNYVDIADVMQISEAAVRALVARGLAALTTKLG
ncbi:MAG: RNA polymerase sigma factor [Planctomycetota bacterium]